MGRSLRTHAVAVVLATCTALVVVCASPTAPGHAVRAAGRGLWEDTPEYGDGASRPAHRGRTGEAAASQWGEALQAGHTTGSNLPVPPSSDTCDIAKVACSPNSTFAPSWCEYQNPLIVARPPTQLANATAISEAYSPRYACYKDFPNGYGQTFAQCQLITHFEATQVYEPTSNITERLVVVGTRDTNSTEYPTSSLQIMDDSFNVVYSPLNGFPGLLSILTLVDQRDEPLTRKYIAYGGGVKLSGDNCAPCCDGDCLAVGVIMFGMDKGASDILEQHLAYCNYPGTAVNNGQFLYPGKRLMPQPGVLFVSLVTNTTGEQFIPFVEAHAASRNDNNCSLAQLWTIPPHVASESEPVVTLKTTYHYSNCSATPNFNYSFGGFYTRAHCVETPLLMVATQQTVMVYAYKGLNQAIEPGLQPAALFFNASAGYRIMDARIFGQQVPPKNLTNTTTLAQDLEPTSQHMYLVVTTSNGHRSELYWVDMPEFAAVHTAGAVSQVNPAGRDVAGAKMCGGNSYYFNHGCHSRLHLMAFNTTFRFTTVEVRWRSVPDADKQQLSKAGCAPFDMACLKKYTETHEKNANSAFEPMLESFLSKGPTSANGVVKEYYSGQYGLRWAVFVATTRRTLEIFHLLPVPSDCDAEMHNVPLLVSQANTLSLMGDVQQFSVTQNGQYVFAAVSRAKWTLKSMERLVEVCAHLEADPDDKFLAPWRSACHSDPAPRLPAIPDFLQIASACLPGTYCPSFVDEQIQAVPAGSYTTFSFDLHKCEPGYMCLQGRRTKCPTGFVCPGEGTILPTRCPVDPTLNTNCYEEGLYEPQICPNGTLCGAPYMPAIPVPPGTMQDYILNPPTPSAPASISRGLYECPAGDWCNLGMYSGLAPSVKKCPAIFYCPTPSVMQPILCNMGGKCTKNNCTTAPYCPAGQTKEIKCPPGHYCERPDKLGNCSAGSYCPAGSGVWGLCPPGSYCSDDGATKTQCPDGYYCPQGVTEPLKCNFLSNCHCAGGCHAPNNFLSVPLLIIIPIVLYVGWKAAKWWIKRRWAKRDAELDERRRMHGSNVSRASNKSAAKRAKARLERKRAGTGAGAGAGAGAASGAGVHVELGSPPPPSRDGLGMPLLDDDGYPSDEEGSGMTEKEFTIDFHFQDLGLVLKKAPHKVVMKGVSGAIRHGRVTAVMGPSGAGKSTFLTTLAGKATYGRQTGVILINGNEVPLSKYSKLVGFVPQEDVMMRYMTVEENLRYCAETRLPRTWSSQKKLLFVDEVLSLLGLRDIRHNQIGDERKRGISGGQRKRVNIGMEMCADPTVLFLDEPTSGLDSTSSMEVCDALRQIAQLGLCVATVIHQPRYEIFTSFDDVLLLGKGGRTVYLGPSEKALDYFESLGFNAPPRVNPADFFMDVIAGDFPPDFKAANPEFKPSDLFDKWTQYQAAHPNPAFTAPPAHPPSPAELAAVGRKTAGLGNLVFQSFKRAMWQHARSKTAVAIDLALVFIASVTLAAVYYGEVLYKPPEPAEIFATCPAKVGKECQLCLSVLSDQILNRGSMTSIAMSLTAVASMIRVFGSERVEYWREASGLPQPLHTIGYFLGKDLAMVPHMLLAPLVFNVVYLSVTTPRGSFATYYWVMLGLYYTATSFGYVVSIVCPPSLAQLCGVVAVFGCAMFAGGMPTLNVLYTKFFPLCYLPYVSYIRYALEALYVGEVINYEKIVALQGVNLEKHLHDTFGYDLNAYSRDVALLFTIGFTLRMVALVLMAVLDRKKKM